MSVSALTLIKQRRAQLAAHYDVRRQFTALEESCVPSYLHANPAAAAISWWRLFAAARLASHFAPPGALLDFGAATGEFWHVLRRRTDRFAYHYVEQDDLLADALVTFHPSAVRCSLEDLKRDRFACIAALDSLEHNEDVDTIVERLVAALSQDGGVMIVSGPTENALYRLGRRIAGFSGDYHTTTIFEIEKTLARHMDRLAIKTVPAPGLGLFRVSAWRRYGDRSTGANKAQSAKAPAATRSENVSGRR